MATDGDQKASLPTADVIKTDGNAPVEKQGTLLLLVSETKTEDKSPELMRNESDRQPYANL